MKYNIGLDLGIASVGWSAVGINDKNEPTHIIDTGVFLVNSLEVPNKGDLHAAARRIARGTRRLIRRRRHRIERLRKLFKKEFNIDILNEDLYKKQKNIYELKVKGISEKLTHEDLLRVLIHYAKHRGFKSNRKNKAAMSKEDGELADNIIKIEEDMKVASLKYPSEYLFNRYLNNENVRNKDNYEIMFKRQAYEDEVKDLLDNQINNNAISEELSNKIFEIIFSQRDFSEGPGKKANGENSPYHVDFAKLYGYCSYRKTELRASTACPSFEIFRLLQKLNDIRFYDGTVDDKNRKVLRNLSKEEISLIYKKINEDKKIFNLKYSDISKILSKDLEFSGVSLSKKSFIDVINKYKKINNIEKNTKIDFKDEEFVKMVQKEKNKKSISKEMIFYKTIYNNLSKLLGKNIVDNYTIENFDDIASGHSYYKTDDRLQRYFNGDDELAACSDFDYTQEEIDAFLQLSLPTSSTASLAISLIRDLNELLSKGYDYTNSMKELGYNHSEISHSLVKCDKIPKISAIQEAFPNEITNPRVIRVLSKTFKIINALIERYGMPYNIHIESSRDIAHTLQGRRKIEQDMLDKFENNRRIKSRIAIDFPQFENMYKVSNDDLLRYKLYLEQNMLCPYSGEMIVYKELFSKKYEVDHILPFSRTFNDSYNNKTLVLASENQAKGNKTPIEYFSSNKERLSQFETLINGNNNFSKVKSNNYLADKIDEGMKSRSLNDTRFINKYLTKVLEQTLDIEGKVETYKSGIVSAYKKLWEVNNLTHSIINANYEQRPIYKYVKGSLKIDFTPGSEKSKITIQFKNCLNNDIESEQLTLDYKLPRLNDYTKAEYEDRYKLIEIFNKDELYIRDLFNNHFEDLSDHKIYLELLELTNLNSSLHTNLILFINDISQQLIQGNIKKDRTNHLHHALDATVVACINKSLSYRITKYLQYQSFKKTNNSEFLHLENNEEILKDANLTLGSTLPYEGFVEEIKYRIYEQNPIKQADLFKNNFNDNLKRSIRVLTPIRERIDKSNKALHKETFFSKAKGEDILLKRVSVLDFDLKKVENIYKKETSAIKPVYLAVKNWVRNKKPTNYPMLPNGREIKKILVIAVDIKKAVKIKDGKYAEINSVVCTDVFKSKNKDDKKLYFLQRHDVNFMKEKEYKEEKSIEEYKLQLWYGQSNNYEYISFKDLFEKYNLFLRVYPNDFISIVTNSGKGSVYSAGFTSGMLEVKSPLGDGSDLISANLSGKIQSQYKITASTIKNIRITNIDILGY